MCDVTQADGTLLGCGKTFLDEQLPLSSTPAILSEGGTGGWDDFLEVVL